MMNNENKRFYFTTSTFPVSVNIYVVLGKSCFHSIVLLSKFSHRSYLFRISADSPTLGPTYGSFTRENTALSTHCAQPCTTQYKPRTSIQSMRPSARTPASYYHCAIFWGHWSIEYHMGWAGWTGNLSMVQ